MSVMRYTSSTVCAVVLTSIAVADTWIVDDDGQADFSTIQSAVEFANDGDEIYVMPGMYTASQSSYVVNLLGKAIWLHSAMGENVTFIDGEGSRRGILCVNGETTTTVIEGFTIQNCDATWFDYDGDSNSDSWESAGGGMGTAHSNPRVIACVFQNNNGHRGGGGMFNFVSSPSVEHCEFLNNVVDDDGSGSGMLNRDSSSPTLINCLFANNVAGYLGGGIYNYDGCSPILTNCTFSNNIANYLGGGMYCRYFSNAVLYNCSFDSNVAMFGGGGLFCSSLSDPTLTDCQFLNNSTTSNQSYAGGMGISNSNPVLQNCIFSNNQTSDDGGGLHCGIGCDATISGCGFNQNVAGNNGGGVYFDLLCNPTITNTIIEKNTAKLNGGGIWCSNQSVITLSQSTIQGNSSALGGDILLRKNSQLLLNGTNNAGEVTLLHLGTTLLFSPGSRFYVNDSLSPAEQGSLNFDVDVFDAPVSLIVNGTLIRQGSLGVTNDSGSLADATVGETVSLMEVTTLSQSPFDSIVLPPMPDGLGLRVIEQALPDGGGTSLALEVIEIEGAEFDEPLLTGLDSVPVDICSFDVNGDGRDEIAVLYGGSPSTVAVFSVTDDGTPPVIIDVLTTVVGNGALDFDAGDLNGDGLQDIVVANADDATVSVLSAYVDGSGTVVFSTVTLQVPGSNITATAIAMIDWDGNADIDVVVSVDMIIESAQDGYQVLLNVASGSSTNGPLFIIPMYQDASGQHIDTSTGVDGLLSGFVGGTMYGGIYSANEESSSLELLAHLEGNNITTIKAVDVDAGSGDGFLDLLIASDTSLSLYILPGDTTESVGFGDLIPISVGKAIADVIAIDADHDGDTDFLFVAPTSAGSSMVLLRNDGGVAGLLPGSMSGLTWSSQIVNSNGSSNKVISGGFKDKDEDDDWVSKEEQSAGILDGHLGRLEQTNLIFAQCIGDFNGDGIVEIHDILILLAAWGSCNGCDADLNGDALVNVDDLYILIAAWGPCGQ